MTNFTPVNTLEMKLRALLTDRNTLTWSFYTPLAAAPLWIFVQNYPELDGSDLVAPPGQNPSICILKGPEVSYIGLYTSLGRAETAFALMKISPQAMQITSAPGYQLLKLVSQHDAQIWINAGLKECQYHLDPDMIEILLSRPEPKYDDQPVHQIDLQTGGDLEKHLAPLHDFLSRQPKVRAAWIYGQKPGPSSAAGNHAYEFNLLMDDPEDDSLLHEVRVMLKALVPVEMECVLVMMMADDQSLHKLSRQKPPFYACPDFLKPIEKGGQSK